MKRLLTVGWVCWASASCAASAKTPDTLDGSPGIVVPGGDGGPGSLSGNSLFVAIRDFKFWNSADPTTNPDFQNVVADDDDIVEDTLGADGKPVYKNMDGGGTVSTHGKAFFDQWYNDTPTFNIHVEHPLALTMNSDGTYGYNSAESGVPLSTTDPRRMWFPIDDGTPYATSFGNQGQLHNYSFTTELHTVFTYNGGESFSFSGDDDVFVFINGQLVINLGGVHATEQASVELDTLGLTKGQTYPLDLFNAERHTDESNLSFTTTLNLQPPAQ